jgi:hypothetical protein
MILFKISKLEFVSNISKFGFRNSQSKQKTHIGFLKNPKQKQKKMPIQTKPSLRGRECKGSLSLFCFPWLGGLTCIW